MPTLEHSRVPLLVVVFLGIVALVLSVGVCILTFYDKKIDGGLFTLAGGAVGALGALLTNARTQPRQDDAMPVKTLPDEPLETTPANAG